MSNFQSTKVIELGSCAFRQWRATHHCSKIHGYQLKAKFWFGANSLDDKNWCVDFASLKTLKALLQNQFDHTLTIAADDPLLPLFQQLHDAGGCDLRVMPNGVGIERAAEYCFEVADAHVREMTNNRCWVDGVEVFEHELNSATYRPVPQIIAATPTIKAAEPINETVPLVNTDAGTLIPVKRAAHVGPNVSSGKGDWFAGTSWGNQ